MLGWDLRDPSASSDSLGAPIPRVAAVRFLNTVPLVWGMLHGPERGLLDLQFCTPAECADRLEEGSADAGIVPVVEIARLGLEPLPGVCIACRGAVRSILLISKTQPERIRTLAADISSRTSVALARVILAERFGADPEFLPAQADVPLMLERADAAVIIGDPALRFAPESSPYRVFDLGEEWVRWTGKPMVFAVWAARPGSPAAALEKAFRSSAAFGLDRVDEIARTEGPARGIPEALAREYLTRHIIFELGENEREGMELFLEFVQRGVVA